MHTHGKMFAWLAVAVIAVGFSSAAMADDLQPPPYRGQPNSTLVHYIYDQIQGLQLIGFDQPGGGFPPYTGDPDGAGPIQPGGAPQIILDQPITPEGHIYEIYVPNVIDQLPFKMVDVQITYQQPVENTWPSVVQIVGGDPITDIEQPQIVDAFPFQPGGPTGPTYIYEHWMGVIYPNPDWEIIRIEMPGDPVQIVIDTISVPEPTTMALMGAGGLLAIRRRRSA